MNPHRWRHPVHLPRRYGLNGFSSFSDRKCTSVTEPDKDGVVASGSIVSATDEENFQDMIVPEKTIFIHENRLHQGNEGMEIIEANACPDHIHRLVSIQPKYSVSELMGYLKGKSSLNDV